MMLMEKSEAHDLISLAKRVPELDAVYAIELAGGSATLYEKTLRAVIRLIPANVEHMDSHIREGGGLADFAVKAHGVKGSMNQIGCFHLAKLAESLEKAAKDGNRPYCEEHYGAFRDGLLRFYDQLSEAAFGEPVSDVSCGGGNALFDAVSRAREAVLEYDALRAADILAPHAIRRSGGEPDALVLKAFEALGAFKYKQALACIDKLLETRKDPAEY